jgi:tetratricopeptide (TPR) repeat protein
LAACWALVLSAAGRDPWVRINSANFEVFTTAGEANGRDIAHHFEQVRGYLVQAFGTAPLEAAPIRIIAFHNAKEYLLYRPDGAGEAFYAGASFHDPNSDRLLTRHYIVMSGAEGKYYPAAVREYVRLLIVEDRLEVPLWLNEGLAQFYSTIGADGAWHTAIGNPPSGMDRTLRSEPWIDLRALLEAAQGSPFQTRGMFAAESWALTQMLMLDERYGPRYMAMMAAFAAGAEAAAAFENAYGKSIEEVQKDLRANVNVRGPLPALRIDLQWAKVAEAPQVSVGSPGAELALAEMAAAVPGKSGQALESYDQLSLEYPAAWEVESGWAEALLLQGKTSEAVPHFARALELGAHSASTFIEYSQTLMAGGHNEEAVSVLRTAAGLNPASGDLHRELGLALAGAGNYLEALGEFALAGDVSAADAVQFYYTVAYAYFRTGNRLLARQTLARTEEYVKTAQEMTMIDALRETLDSDSNRPADSLSSPAPEETETASPTPPNPAPFKVAEGTLQVVDCNRKLLRLLVAGSVVVLQILDPEQTAVKSADGGDIELTCGPQNAIRIRVEFDAPPDLSQGIAGIVRSIEFP